MRQIRVYLDAALTAGAHVPLPAHAAEHLLRVLRLGDGAPVVAFNGDGRDYAATLEVRPRAEGWLHVGEAQDAAAESPLALTLVQGVARGEKMDLILQKATELGVARIVPVSTERSEVKLDEERAQRRLVHWRRVVESACEQSGRARVPEIAAPRSLAHWVAALPPPSGEWRLALHPESDTRIGQLAPSAEGWLVVGPEGGLSERDLATLALAGFQRLGLGPRILRTETAGLAALAALQTRFGDLG